MEIILDILYEAEKIEALPNHQNWHNTSHNVDPGNLKQPNLYLFSSTLKNDSHNHALWK